MQAYLAYIKSRVTAMRGDIHQAIEFCLAARAYSPAGNLALQLDTCITLGYEYFLSGDYASACQVLDEAIQTGLAAGGTIYVVASACILARLYANQGRLQQSADTYRWATQLISGASGEHRDARALAAVGMAEVYCEWNDLEAALAHVKQGLALLPFWGKTDDSILAYVILARIYLAQANRSQAQEAVEKASQLVQSRGIFSEARNAVEAIQVKMWLAQGDRPSVDRWVSTFEKRFGSPDPFRFEDELSHITQARVLMAQNKVQEAIHLLSSLEEATRSGGRQGRLIECLVLKALALQAAGEASQALLVLEDSLGLAEPNRYMRIFLDEGQPMRALLARWLAHSSSGKLRDYADHLLSQLEAELDSAAVEQKKTSHAGEPQAASSQPLVEPLSQRELEVLRLMASGRTNKEIARELIVAPGTVKAHTASIYRKLDVANRTQAVARARQLAILP
jgi:LuxR family maltose regulon positive regulatory protein